MTHSVCLTWSSSCSIEGLNNSINPSAKASLVGDSPKSSVLSSIDVVVLAVSSIPKQENIYKFFHYLYMIKGFMMEKDKILHFS